MKDWQDAETRIERAQQLSEQHRWAEALDEVDAALAINPEDPAWHTQRGHILDQLARHEEAAEAYRAALELNPEAPEVDTALCIDLIRTGRHADAVSRLERLAQQEPDFEPAYCNRIAAYTRLGDHEMAEQMFYQAQNISGLGMDTNVIGRLKIPGQPEPESPRIRVIYVRDLTAETHGNAVGMGLADIISRRLFEKIDYGATYENAATSTFLERAKVPMIADTDSQAMDWVLRGLGSPDPAGLRIIRIRNTLKLDFLAVSASVLQDLRGREDIEVVSPAVDLLDPAGSVAPFRVE